MKGIFYSVEIEVGDNGYPELETRDFSLALKLYRKLVREPYQGVCTIALVVHCGDDESVIYECEKY